MQLRTPIALALCGAVFLSGAAFAQSSTGAPSGMEPATAPGGTEGSAGMRNEREAVRSGDAVVVPPGTGGVAAEPSSPPMERLTPPPSRP